jgi:hypothetical protein
MGKTAQSWPRKEKNLYGKFVLSKQMAKKSGKKEMGEDKNHSKEHILEDTKRKTEYLLRRASISEIEVYGLVKFFFKKFLKKENELTCEELVSELGNIYLEEDLKNDFKKFLDEIYLMEYSQKAFSSEELKLLVKEFDNLIERLIVPVPKPGKAKFLGLFHRKAKREKEFLELENKLKALEKAEKQKAAHTPEERLQIMIDKIRLLIKQENLNYAKEEYKELITEYELSHKDAQKKFYKEINNLFKEIKVSTSS